MKPNVIGSAILGLAVAVSAGIYLPVLADSNPAQQTGNSIASGSQTAIAPKEATAVQERLAGAADSAATHGGYDAMVGSFDKATRDRLGLEKDKNLDQLNARIDQFRKDFKDKYNEDYNLKAADLNSIPVNRGSDADHALVDLSSFPILKGLNSTALQVAPGEKVGTNPHVPMPMTGQINLVREKELVGNGWRIAISETITGQQLREALGNKLAAISNDKAQWPADVHAAYTTFGGQILEALTQPNANITAMNQ